MEDEKNTDQERAAPYEASPGPTEVPGASRTGFSRLMSRRRWMLVTVLLLGLTAVLLMLMLSRGSGNGAGRPVPAPEGGLVPPSSGESSGGARSMPGDITITLTGNELENAQIMIEAATTQSATAAPVGGGVRTTGTVQANEYKETPIFPIAGGIVRQVNAELGDRVSRGKSLAAIFSTELGDAQSEYLKMLAESEEHHKHHLRAVELVEIGAISREEVEEATSKYKSAQANVASARQRLILLGLSPNQIDGLKEPSQISSLISVSSPVSGTVINRDVNVGEIVEESRELFRVADLSTVWVIGQVYENDFRSVRVGTPALITTNAYPGQSFRGRVSYIDPRVDPNARTSQVRVEVPNPGMMLRLGMFVDVTLGSAAQTASTGQPTVFVPRAAIQNIGSKQVVYLATGQSGVFLQREVSAGPEANGLIPLYSGVSPGDRVVTEGSFLLRAESLKLNPAQSTSSNSSSQVLPLPQHGTRTEEQQTAVEKGELLKIQTARIVLTGEGFNPASIRFRKDVPVRLTFVRQVEVTCGTEVVIADYNIKRQLPLNEPVVVEFTPAKPGQITFVCGMNMLRGKIVVN
ncbi:MAG TPA: efflux RND transporter periplasmic adaptor subunit [Blastocatellia bacterium]|nr:efflux RND transporter periplasmic adaptor subunit [Blastocatellia bacterium]